MRITIINSYLPAVSGTPTRMYQETTTIGGEALVLADHTSKTQGTSRAKLIRSINNAIDTTEREVTIDRRLPITAVAIALEPQPDGKLKIVPYVDVSLDNSSGAITVLPNTVAYFAFDEAVCTNLLNGTDNHWRFCFAHFQNGHEQDWIYANVDIWPGRSKVIFSFTKGPERIDVSAANAYTGNGITTGLPTAYAMEYCMKYASQNFGLSGSFGVYPANGMDPVVSSTVSEEILSTVANAQEAAANAAAAVGEAQVAANASAASAVRAEEFVQQAYRSYVSI